MELLSIVIPSTEYSATVQYKRNGQGIAARTTLTVRSDDRKRAVRTLGIMAELLYGRHYVITELLRWDINGRPHPVWDDGDDV